MYHCSIFQQLFKFIPRYRFDKMVEKVSSDRYFKSFSAWQQYIAPIESRAKLRECQKGVLDEREKTMEASIDLQTDHTRKRRKRQVMPQTKPHPQAGVCPGGADTDRPTETRRQKTEYNGV